MEEMIRIQYYQSPCGELILGSYKGKLCLCDWQNEERRRLIDERIQKGLQAQYIEKESETITNAITQLDEYFNHRRKAFDIPLLFIGTDFQKSVWNELLNIPYGTTVSYAGLSERLGNPKAIRAVAAANGANAISIIVPCHRVIGSNQKLTGYAGGLPAKKLLLELESPMQSLL
ncbi:MAG: Methylated-DNA--protein-cysteine methyltransferase [Parabacteroides sp.]